MQPRMQLRRRASSKTAGVASAFLSFSLPKPAAEEPPEIEVQPPPLPKSQSEKPRFRPSSAVDRRRAVLDMVRILSSAPSSDSRAGRPHRQVRRSAPSTVNIRGAASPSTPKHAAHPRIMQRTWGEGHGHMVGPPKSPVRTVRDEGRGHVRGGSQTQDGRGQVLGGIGDEGRGQGRSISPKTTPRRSPHPPRSPQSPFSYSPRTSSHSRPHDYSDSPSPHHDREQSPTSSASIPLFGEHVIEPHGHGNWGYSWSPSEAELGEETFADDDSGRYHRHPQQHHRRRHESASPIVGRRKQREKAARKAARDAARGAARNAAAEHAAREASSLRAGNCSSPGQFSGRGPSSQNPGSAPPKSRAEGGSPYSFRGDARQARAAAASAHKLALVQAFTERGERAYRGRLERAKREGEIEMLQTKTAEMLLNLRDHTNRSKRKHKQLRERIVHLENVCAELEDLLKGEKFIAPSLYAHRSNQSLNSGRPNSPGSPRSPGSPNAMAWGGGDGGAFTSRASLGSRGSSGMLDLADGESNEADKLVYTNYLLVLKQTRDAATKAKKAKAKKRERRNGGEIAGGSDGGGGDGVSGSGSGRGGGEDGNGGEGGVDRAVEAMNVAKAAAAAVELEMNDLKARMLALPEGSQEQMALEEEFFVKTAEFKQAQQHVEAAEAAVALAGAAVEAMNVAKAAAAAVEAVELEMNDLKARMLALPEGSQERMALEDEFFVKKAELKQAQQHVKAAEKAVALLRAVEEGGEDGGGEDEEDIEERKPELMPPLGEEERIMGSWERGELATFLGWFESMSGLFMTSASRTDDSLTCVLCRKLLAFPFTFQMCGHSFCSNCIFSADILAETDIGVYEDLNTQVEWADETCPHPNCKVTRAADVCRRDHTLWDVVARYGTRSAAQSNLVHMVESLRQDKVLLLKNRRQGFGSKNSKRSSEMSSARNRASGDDEEARLRAAIQIQSQLSLSTQSVASERGGEGGEDVVSGSGAMEEA